MSRGYLQCRRDVHVVCLLARLLGAAGDGAGSGQSAHVRPLRHRQRPGQAAYVRRTAHSS